MRALSLLPDGPNYRAGAFRRGLEAAGFEVAAFDRPERGDCLLIWNRYPRHETIARKFEQAGGTVLVIENGYFGKDWIGKKWFAISRGHHNGAGTWPRGGWERWERWHVAIAPWRAEGETVILSQRGYGEPGVKMPEGWPAEAARDHPGARHRPHPGPGADTLEGDLAGAGRVVTWASGAALRALLWGIPVEAWSPSWIGAAAASRPGEPAFRGDPLPMFRRLAWAMWTADEVESGEAFRCIFW